MDAKSQEQQSRTAGGIQHQQQLTSHLQAIKDDCRQLAFDLSSLSAQLTAGRLEGLSTVEEKIAGLQKRFRDIKADVFQQARSFIEVSQTEFEGIHSLDNLEEILRISERKLREEAVAILDQVLSLAPADARPLESLQTCQKRAAQLKEAITATTMPEIHPEMPSLVEGTHPFALLLRMVTDSDTLSDEMVLSLEDGIGPAFGKMLFIAALRGKIFFPKKPTVAVSEDRTVSITLVDSPKSAMLVQDGISAMPEEVQPELGHRRDDVYAVPSAGAEEHPLPSSPAATTSVPSPSEPLSSKSPGKPISAKSQEAFDRALEMLKKKLERAWINKIIPEEEYNRIREMCVRWERLHPDIVQYREEVQKLGNVQSQLDMREDSAIEEKRRALIREILQAKNPA